MAGTSTRRRAWLAGAGLGAATAVTLGWAGYAALAWSRYGKPSHAAGSDDLLDRYMPVFEVREAHETEVAAPAPLTWQAAVNLDFTGSPIVRAIFRGRELLMGARRRDTRPQRFLQEILALGWAALTEEPGREMVFGAATQPWQAEVRFRAIPAEEFAAFREPGYAKIVWSISVESLGPTSSRFRTETRVATTDPHSRARFRRYWAIFSPGIFLIRYETLRLVRAEAERLPSTVLQPFVTADRRSST